MAMTKASMKDKILTKITAANPNLKPEDSAIIGTILEAFCDGIIEEIQQNGTIEMAQADISVLPGTFKDSTNQPITGAGINDAFSLTGKIK